jgi:hypothetical protein
MATSLKKVTFNLDDFHCSARMLGTAIIVAGGQVVTLANPQPGGPAVMEALLDMPDEVWESTGGAKAYLKLVARKVKRLQATEKSSILLERSSVARNSDGYLSLQTIINHGELTTTQIAEILRCNLGDHTNKRRYVESEPMDLNRYEERCNDLNNPAPRQGQSSSSEANVHEAISAQAKRARLALLLAGASRSEITDDLISRTAKQSQGEGVVAAAHGIYPALELVSRVTHAVTQKEIQFEAMKLKRKPDHLKSDTPPEGNYLRLTFPADFQNDQDALRQSMKMLERQYNLKCRLIKADETPGDDTRRLALLISAEALSRLSTRLSSGEVSTDPSSLVSIPFRRQPPAGSTVSTHAVRVAGAGSDDLGVAM